MVVDDEPAICEITKCTLEAFGYRVIIAVNGSEAIAIYSTKAQEIALVLTDMMMPVMDGATAIQKMKSINPSALIVAVSGLNIHPDARATVHEFLAKPYTSLELVQLVRNMLHPQIEAPT